MCVFLNSFAAFLQTIDFFKEFIFSRLFLAVQFCKIEPNCVVQFFLKFLDET